MIYENFNMREHNFVGHLAEPEQGSDKAVIVIMGGEQSLFPGIKIAERFADYGMVGPSVSLFGADGQSKGSIFAALVAEYIGGIESVIMVSPTHVPFEGTLKDKKHMSGHSIATWRGRDIPYVTADFSKVKAGKYQKHPAAAHKVTGMMPNKEREKKLYRLIPLIGFMYKSLSKHKKECKNAEIIRKIEMKWKGKQI